jgi:hypothetical protein
VQQRLAGFSRERKARFCSIGWIVEFKPQNRISWATKIMISVDFVAQETQNKHVALYPLGYNTC